MENKTQHKDYEIRKAQAREVRLPEIDLLPQIQHNGRSLDMALFGKGDKADMSIPRFHSIQLPKVSFRPATTSESIAMAVHGFGKNGEYDVKRDILEKGRVIQLGYVVQTQEGVFTNTRLTDEASLKQLLNRARKVNGIYFIDDNVAFAPYESFELTSDQSTDTFIRGGLARALEHTDAKVAENLRTITSPQFYNHTKRVSSMEIHKEQNPWLGNCFLGICHLHLNDYPGKRVLLNAVQSTWGFAFGVLNKGK